MPKFNFKAQKSNGETYEGTRDASDKNALYKDLKKDGDTLVSVSEVKAGKKGEMSFDLFSSVRTIDKILFAKNLSTMLDAGLPLTRALSVLERQAKRKKLKEIFSRIGAEITKGGTLSQALELYPKVFPTLFVSMIKAGEESGAISAALRAIGNQLDKSYLLSKKIRGAMMYPAIVVSVMIIIGFLMLVYLVPTLTKTFTELKLELPISTRIVIGISDFLNNHFLFSVSGIGVFILCTILFFRTRSGKRILDFVFLHMPVIGPLVKETNSARTARTLSSLLSAGVEFLVAVRITEEVLQNSYYKDIMKKATLAVEKGEPISEVLMKEDNFYPVFVSEMASIGEETGKLSDMLLNVADFYENEVDQKTKDMSTIIEPFLMIAVGIAVGFFAISMLGPTYSLVNAI